MSSNTFIHQMENRKMKSIFPTEQTFFAFKLYKDSSFFTFTLDTNRGVCRPLIIKMFLVAGWKTTIIHIKIQFYFCTPKCQNFTPSFPQTLTQCLFK